MWPRSSAVILESTPRSSGMRVLASCAPPSTTWNEPMFIAGEPMKPATKTLTGWSYRSRGSPTCCSTPSLSTAIRSPIVMASVWSCVTTVYVTHDQTEAMTMGDRIAVLKDGLLQQVGDPRDLYDQPVNVFV